MRNRLWLVTLAPLPLRSSESLIYLSTHTFSEQAQGAPAGSAHPQEEALAQPDDDDEEEEQGPGAYVDDAWSRRSKMHMYLSMPYTASSRPQQHDGGPLSRLESLRLVDLAIPTASLLAWIEGLAHHGARLHVCGWLAQLSVRVNPLWRVIPGYQCNEHTDPGAGRRHEHGSLPHREHQPGHRRRRICPARDAPPGRPVRACVYLTFLASWLCCSNCR